MQDSVNIKTIATSFAEFANQLICIPNVQNALNSLKLHATLNHNVILYGIWRGLQQQGRLNKQDYKTLLAVIQTWHERILKALRGLLELTSHSANKKLEIQNYIKAEISHAEHIERQLLAETSIKFSTRKRPLFQQLHDACHNITTYCNLIKFTFTHVDQSLMTELLQAAFPTLMASDINNAYKNISSLHLQKSSFCQLTLMEV